MLLRNKSSRANASPLLFFCQNRFLYFVENCVISTPIILQCRSVADLYWRQGGEDCSGRDNGFRSSSSSSSRSEQPPRRPVVCYIVCLSFFFLASQSNEQRTCLFFLFFSLCDSVVRLSIVYKKNSLSCLSLSLSQSLSLILTLSCCHGALEQT